MSSNALRSWPICGLLLATTWLASCGGGGGGDRYAGIDGSGERPRVTASGPINGFGSVIVNGVHYNTDNADIYVKGQPAEEYELDLGDIVTVVGYSTGPYEGEALEIYYQPKLSGKVEWVDSENERFGLLSQTVIIDGDTLIDNDMGPGNISAIQVGQFLSVSGSTDASAAIRATRIDLADSDAVEISGEVSKLDPQAEEFEISGVKIQYGQVSNKQGLLPGQQVLVSGSRDDNNILQAQWIDYSLSALGAGQITQKEVSGYISNYMGMNSFKIDDTQVQMSSSTVFENGSLSLLADNHKTQVKGLYKDKILYAESIKFLASSNIQLRGEIESVELQYYNYHLLGYITVEGNRFAVSPYTFMQKPYERYVTLGSYSAGEAVSISAYYHEATGELYASHISGMWSPNEDFESSIQGPAYAFDPMNRTFAIFNTYVGINENTLLIDALPGETIDQYFARLYGKSVEVKGIQTFGFISASSVKIIGNAQF